MRSTAETTSEPSSVSRVPWTSRVNSVAPICRSKSSIRLRTTLIDRSSRSAADLKLPHRTTSRNTLAASQSVKPLKPIFGVPPEERPFPVTDAYMAPSCR